MYNKFVFYKTFLKPSGHIVSVFTTKLYFLLGKVKQKWKNLNIIISIIKISVRYFQLATLYISRANVIPLLIFFKQFLEK